jgi:hypothetical protein
VFSAACATEKEPMTTQAVAVLPERAAAVAAGHAAGPSGARRLQLALAGVWLLDALLQFQAFMFTRGFGDMLAAAARGNPPVVAGPIDWSAALIERYDSAANAAFAGIQLLIALGIAWRPTVKLALGVSIIWCLSVWWLGEGLGGLVNGSASPVNGAPGPVLIYALLAVLVWPSANNSIPRERPSRITRLASSAAGWFTKPAIAKVAWLALWGGLAGLSVLPATRAPHALGRLIARSGAGQPTWLARVDSRLAALVGPHGPAVAIALAVLLAVVALGVYLPRRASRAVLVLAIVTAAAIWVAEGLGGILTGNGTDPSSGLLLALLALALWPLSGTNAGPAEPLSGGQA